MIWIIQPCILILEISVATLNHPTNSTVHLSKRSCITRAYTRLIADTAHAGLSALDNFAKQNKLYCEQPLIIAKSLLLSYLFL